MQLNAFQAAVHIDEKAQECSVEVLFHHTVGDVQVENSHVTAVLAAGSERLERLEANEFIGCSSDGLPSALVDAQFELAQELHPATRSTLF